MIRAFHRNAVPENPEKIILSPEESFHLSKVLRANLGEKVEILDGNGKIFSGKIARGNAKSLEIAVEKTEIVPAPKCKISLAQVMPKGAAMDEIVRQATEIGANEIFPLTSERCEVHLDESRTNKRLERWNSIAEEACKQCRNAFLPKIFPVTKLQNFLEKFAVPGELSKLALIASLGAGTKMADEAVEALKKNPPKEILWLVGPEGDFSESEYLSAKEAGFVPVRFGKNVLRSVTAAIYSLAVADQMRQKFFSEIL